MKALLQPWVDDHLGDKAALCCQHAALSGLAPHLTAVILETKEQKQRSALGPGPERTGHSDSAAAASPSGV